MLIITGIPPKVSVVENLATEKFLGMNLMKYDVLDLAQSQMTFGDQKYPFNLTPKYTRPLVMTTTFIPRAGSEIINAVLQA